VKRIYIDFLTLSARRLLYIITSAWRQTIKHFLFVYLLVSQLNGLFVCSLVCLFACLVGCGYVCLSVRSNSLFLFFYVVVLLGGYVCVCLLAIFVCVLVCLLACLFVCLFVECLLVCLIVCLFVCVCVCVCVRACLFARMLVVVAVY
jgi:hypothetical protein